MRNAKLSLNLEDIHISFVQTSSSTPLDKNIFGDNWRNLKVDCMLDDRSYIDLDVVMIMILWENVLTFVKYVLKYSDDILMFEDYFQICVFRCICVCVSGYMCVEKEKERWRKCQRVKRLLVDEMGEGYVDAH